MSENQKPKIDADACTGCSICLDECPTNALDMGSDIAELVRPEDCDGCGSCEEACPVSAIIME